MKVLKVFLCTVLLLAISNVANAASKKKVVSGDLKCTSVIDAAGTGNVLYKGANLHGGRGRTFLDQGHRLGGTRTLTVAGTNGKKIGCFGLYACDRPYGCRYYQAMCRDGSSNSQIAAKARANGGSTSALVGNGSGRCIKINIGVARYGSVRK